MAYLILRTYLGDIKPRLLFLEYLANDAERTDKEQWVNNLKWMKICDTYEEAYEYAQKIVRPEGNEGQWVVTWDVVEKKDDYLAKISLQKDTFGV